MDMSTNLKINLIGPWGSGKTRLLITAGQTILGHGWPVENLIIWTEELVSTIGGHYVNFGPLKIEDEVEPLSFAVWDLGGQNRYTSVRKVYLEETNGILAVIDLCRAHSLEILVNAMLKQEVRTVCEENIPICLVGNKIDLRAEILDKKGELATLIWEHLEKVQDQQELSAEVHVKTGPEKGKREIAIDKAKIGDRTALKAADLEIILFNLLKDNYLGDTFTEMNLKLLSREFWVTMANTVLQETLSYDIPYTVLEKANLDPPLFKEYLKDPEILIPIDWSEEELKQMVQDSLLSMDILNKAANELGAAGYNIRGTLAASATEKTNAMESLTFVFKEGIDYYRSLGK
jgi:small GTP-binding protein